MLKNEMFLSNNADSGIVVNEITSGQTENLECESSISEPEKGTLCEEKVIVKSQK